eukprot:TRINITY_DN5156_c0_g1_i3.p2 TRINITY_DN5156_c0_g1~~TRINITY_DN5156_c0_g1_i3.p2  ORF type:complete len:268 (-),score=74.28 TRINITY_DN5156_c0_g1_i3:9-812(-)
MGLLASEIKELFPSLRHKVSLQLQDWMPPDPTAHALIKPWLGLLDDASADLLLRTTVLPKLVYVLRESAVDPSNQDLMAIRAVLVWADIFPPAVLSTLLEAEFFPKWLRALATWLQHKADYDEVTRWYLGWKSLLPPALLSQPGIQKQFTRALDMMNSAATGSAPVRVPEPVGVPIVPVALASSTRKQEHVHVGGGMDISFKELVAQVAAEANVAFAPKKTYDAETGKQLYSFGRSTVMIDRDVVFVRASADAPWRPVSLEDLPQFA